MELDKLQFPVVEFLQRWNIPSEQQTRGAVNVCCPFCGDEGFHCGIFLDTSSNFSCWKCKAGGHIYKLLRRLTGITWDEFLRIAKTRLAPRESAVDRINRIFSAEETEPTDGCELPPEAVEISTVLIDTYPALSRFLCERISGDFLTPHPAISVCNKYGAKYCSHGKYGSRLIIPIYRDGDLVAFTARDVTNNPRCSKYMTSPGADLADVLYGLNHWEGRTMIVVEGALDVWAIGSSSVACLGSSLSGGQISRIAKSGVSEVVLAFDADVFDLTRADSRGKLKRLGEAAGTINLFAKVRIARFPDGQDPSSLKDDALKYIVEAQQWETMSLRV